MKLVINKDKTPKSKVSIPFSIIHTYIHISQLLKKSYSDLKSHSVNTDVASSPFHAQISAVENVLAFN